MRPEGPWVQRKYGDRRSLLVCQTFPPRTFRHFWGLKFLLIPLLVPSTAPELETLQGQHHTLPELISPVGKQTAHRDSDHARGAVILEKRHNKPAVPTQEGSGNWGLHRR